MKNINTEDFEFVLKYAFTKGYSLTGIEVSTVLEYIKSDEDFNSLDKIIKNLIDEKVIYPLTWNKNNKE